VINPLPLGDAQVTTTFRLFKRMTSVFGVAYAACCRTEPGAVGDLSDIPQTTLKTWMGISQN
jgi:hypothetical protein